MTEDSEVEGDAFEPGSVVGAVRVTSRPFFRSIPAEQLDKWIGLVFPVRVRFLQGAKKFYLVAWEDILRVLGESDPNSQKWWQEEYAGGILRMSEDGFITLDESFCESVPD